MQVLVKKEARKAPPSSYSVILLPPTVILPVFIPLNTIDLPCSFLLNVTLSFIGDILRQ